MENTLKIQIINKVFTTKNKTKQNKTNKKKKNFSPHLLKSILQKKNEVYYYINYI